MKKGNQKMKKKRKSNKSKNKICNNGKKQIIKLGNDL